MKNELRITFDSNDNCRRRCFKKMLKDAFTELVNDLFTEDDEGEKKMKNKNPLKRNLNRESKPFLIVEKVNDDKAISNIKNIDSELELMSLTTSAVATSIVVAKRGIYRLY